MRRLREGLQGQACRHGGGAGGAPLAEAVTRFEALDDMLGRIGSYAGAHLRRQLDRSGARQVLRRHAGAPHRRLAASSVLHARTQPHRRRRAGRGDGRSGARPLPAVDRGRAQGQALSARGPRRGAVPREVGDRLFGLEPAVRRDHRQPALQDRRQGADDRADAQSAAGHRRQEAQGRRARRWPRPSRKTCGPSRSSPTRSPRTRKSPTAGAASRTSPTRGICRTASSPRWSRRWSPPCARPIRGCRTATTR